MNITYNLKENANVHVYNNINQAATVRMNWSGVNGRSQRTATDTMSSTDTVTLPRGQTVSMVRKPNSLNWSVLTSNGTTTNYDDQGTGNIKNIIYLI